MKEIVTRFAPSPTGFLHVGGLRTALYAFLQAKQSGGRFILRIEDTDQSRTVSGGIENILESLSWAGIHPDEGVIISKDGYTEKGDYGPYIQSKRLDLYKKYALELVENKKAYYCFCTPERLERLREEQQRNKQTPGYDGHCHTLSEKEISERLANNESYVIRLKMPDEGDCVFNDKIRGEVTFAYKDVDDQVLMKSDGFPTYHLAVVVDDHFMNVTDVIRGEEWISSTPKHIYLYECFGWDVPTFAHLPLLLNSDRSKLSKRQGDVAVLDYKEKGYIPEALVNFVAFLGWNPGDERELFKLDELISSFDISKVQKGGAFFNLEKLDWYNREYLKRYTDAEFMDYVYPVLHTIAPENPHKDEIIKRLVPTVRERISKSYDITETYEETLKYFFETPTVNEELLVWKTLKDDPDRIAKTHKSLHIVYEALLSLSDEDWSDKENIKSVVWPLTDIHGRGELLWPFRALLSGKEKSPDPFELAYILGKTETLTRLSNYIVYE